MMKSETKQVFKKSPNVLFRKDAELYLVMINDSFDSYFELSAWACRYWDLLDGITPQERIGSKIAKESNQKKDVIIKEINKLTNKLIKLNLVEKVTKAK